MIERRVGMRRATEAQEHAATALAFQKSKRFLNGVARDYARREHPDFRGRGKFRKNVREQLSGMYIDSLSSSPDIRGSAEVSTEDPKPVTEVKKLFRRRMPEVKRIHEVELSQAPEIGSIRRGLIASETVVFMNGSEKQSKQLLESVGYSNAEAKFMWGKLAIAGVLDAITTVPAVVGIGAAVTVETLTHIVPNITDAKVAASYLALYGITALVAVTNKLLLDNPTIKTCANAVAAAGYYFTPKITEKWKKTAEWVGTTLGSFAPNLIGEISTWGLIGPFAGSEGVFARNAASTGIAVATILGNLGWWAHAKRKERQFQIEK